MRKTVLVYGLIAGLMIVLLGWTVYHLCFVGITTFDNSTYIGYAGMLVVFSMIYFGIRSYRDGPGGGTVTFWRAAAIGILIALLASLFQSVGWFLYNAFNPDFKVFFIEKFTEYKLNSLPDPLDPAAAAAVNGEIEMLKTIYENPLLDLAFSTLLMLPAALVVTLLSAIVLRRRATVEEL